MGIAVAVAGGAKCPDHGVTGLAAVDAGSATGEMSPGNASRDGELALALFNPGELAR